MLKEGNRLTVYTKPNCPDCVKTTTDMESKGIEYTAVNMFKDKSILNMIKDMGFRNAPVVITAEGERWSGYNPARISELAANTDDDTWDF